MSHIGLVTLVVDSYDEAIAHFTGDLGFTLVTDEDQGDKRWVVVAPPGSAETSGTTHLLLAQAGNEEQRARIGDQTGGRVFLFLHTDDFERDRQKMTAAGVEFLEEPRREPYGNVAVFRDRLGNLWDLLEPISPPVPAESARARASS